MTVERLINAFFHHIVRQATEWKYRQRWKAMGGYSERPISIISQNCVGGIIYHTLRMPFLSPTINLTIEADDFVKFVENLPYYINISPVAVTDSYIEKGTGKSYPRFKIGDVSINCVHYKTCKEAICAWERRKKRINFENIFIIANTWDLNEREELIRKVLATTYRTVILTANEKYKGDNRMVYIDGNFKLDKNNHPYPSPVDFIDYSSYRYFEKNFDYLRLLEKSGTKQK